MDNNEGIRRIDLGAELEREERRTTKEHWQRLLYKEDTRSRRAMSQSREPFFDQQAVMDPSPKLLGALEQVTSPDPVTVLDPSTAPLAPAFT